MSQQELKNILEAAMFAAERPLSLDDLAGLFESGEWTPERKEIREALDRLAEEWQERGIELKQVASGFRFQVRKEYSGWLAGLWSERPPRYTRALMETLALIAYRQPITRGEIEDVRGVSVSPSIIKTLLEREWIRVLGHRDVPGRPELFGTTRQFLDSFNLKSLDDLPPLSEIKDLDSMPEDLFSTVPVLTVVETPKPESTPTEEEHDESRAEGEPVTSDAG
ncbi:MAG: SMC-Scp complex subunit ScpB [Gammaproteobacteria bacterium]|nr:SMC-Scp complex subunit ScpB [Gammaproteobacteria bacterium]NIM71620.1 SMC-Scp complex subunit ScpB [Gammaproteobacteria bacterium]NIN37168.1 SMC-Scp complex subunit ScpB [Gammaproteobacteria bacterium]NIO23360.1 SMC-Scp complex subunit ScpB [Gammaproteobacteria bacterium]NIO63988.1 SMC-Scp complex subunit ScpB [Gammaproteobacteria bacterium]